MTARDVSSALHGLSGLQVWVAESVMFTGCVRGVQCADGLIQVFVEIEALDLKVDLHNERRHERAQKKQRHTSEQRPRRHRGAGVSAEAYQCDSTTRTLSARSVIARTASDPPCFVFANRLHALDSDTLAA